jgi:hypothetical protein
MTYTIIRMGGAFCVMHGNRLAERFPTQRKPERFVAPCTLAAVAPTASSWAVRHWLKLTDNTTEHST